MANRRTTPDEVQIRTSPREPVTDPTLGIEVPRGAASTARHRLVTIGDSLTHGFMSAAVHRTDLSWPAIAAYELGLTAEQFTLPDVRVADRTGRAAAGPGAAGASVREAVRRPPRLLGDRDARDCGCGPTWTGSRTTGSAATARGRHRAGPPFHNMAVYGWDLLDPQLLTSTMVAARLGRPTKDDPLSQLVEHHQDRAAWPVLQRARKGNRGRTVLDAVTDMSGPGQGVETLVVVLGLQQRPRRGRLAGARVDTRGVRRPAARGAPGGPRRLQPVAPQRVRRRLVLARGEAARSRRPARHHRDGPVGHDRADRPRHLQEGPARVAVLPLLHAALDHRRRLRHQARPAHHRGRGPGHRLGHRRLQRDDDRLRRRGPPRRPRLVPVRHGRRSSTGSRPGATSTVRGPGRPGGRRTSCPPALRALDPVPEHPVLPVRARWAHRRRPVLPRRRAPDDDRATASSPRRSSR